MNPLSHLHSLTNRILNAPANAYGELFAAADELYNFLLQVSDINTDEDKNREHIHLDTGNAIGPVWAAMCIKDLIRTKKFMDGVYESVNNTVQKKTEGPVHILYAGTGPFATLALPLTARFSSSQLQFTLLEINEYSFDSLKRLMSTLQLEQYIQRVEKTDATLWKTDPAYPVDIFISETMNIGLTKEPQVAIFMNIIPQLKEEAIIIPGKVRLRAALIDMVKRMKSKMDNEQEDNSICELDGIFELSKETVLSHATAFKGSAESYKFPERTVTIPAEMAATYSQFSILTDITVYNTIQILTDESSLTTPLKLIEFKGTAPEKIKCYYETGKYPGVRFMV